MSEHLHDCCSLSVYEQVNRYDPTRTTALRNAFVSDMKRRFRKLKKSIRIEVIDNKFFDDLLIQTDFDFPRSGDKVMSFMYWLRRETERELLYIGAMQQLGSPIDDSWMNLYLTDSYKRGVLRATYEMQKAGYPVTGIEQRGGAGAVLGTPFHVDRMGLVFTRAFTELQGITSAMDGQISRILAQGIADGDGPRVLARKMLNTISGPTGDLGITDTLGRFIPAERRAHMLARTEVIRAHHMGMIQEYRNWKVAGVEVLAEFRTAGDDRVCEECESLQGQRYDLNTIENMIPRHPNCRCIALPIPKENIYEEV